MAAQQQSLFDTEAPAWEVDARSQQLVATVVFAEQPVGQFDYAVPAELADRRQPLVVEAGRRVRVPLGRGNRSRVAYCVDVGTKRTDGRTLKSVTRVLDRAALLSPPLVRLCRWMADYYLCPLGRVLEGVIPAGVRHQAGTRKVTLLEVPTEIAARITQLDLPEKQRVALAQLAASDKPLTAAQLAARVGCTVGPINSLRKKGFLTEHQTRVDSADELGDGQLEQPTEHGPHQLNEDQRGALSEITTALESRTHSTLLVHGVTGSGKTEVYIQAIEQVIGFGRQAIVLVPEISLTPQTVARFRARFQSVAILHSHQTDVERHRHWQRIARGEVQVVVGARSAVFAPTPHLGLIILDEEHENTFKQEIAPRYHARDVARQRASDEGVPLVLGTATPSLESWQRAVVGEYRLISMPRRVQNLPLPSVQTIDLRTESYDRTSRGAISRPLATAMSAALSEGGQVILLLNRRGFSTHLQCLHCGEVVTCPDCAMSLTFHRQQNSAMCHYCDYVTPPPDRCPSCQDPGIRYGGLGTQKLEDEVRARFPDAPCLRMDTDSMRRPGSHQAALADFRSGKARILLGTQMIAKGLDFPNVTLVGVVNADTAIHLPDFRAGERTFQLVTQVAGRTGRGPQGGRVLVQTLSPDHPALVAAASHNFPQFAESELPGRQLGLYPPFASLVRIVVRSEKEPHAKATADELGRHFRRFLQTADTQARMHGPAEAPLAKIRGQYRCHILLHAADAQWLRSTVSQVVDRAKPVDGVTCVVDVDPVDML